MGNNTAMTHASTGDHSRSPVRGAPLTHMLLLPLLLLPGLAWQAGCRRPEQPPDVQKQLRRLEGDSEEELYTALRNLQSLSAGAAVAVPDLRALLKRTTDPDTRAEIAKTLGTIGPGAAASVPDLVAMLDHKAMWPRYCAVEALGKMGVAGTVALPKITQLTRDKDPDVAAAAIDAVRRLRRAPPKR